MRYRSFHSALRISMFTLVLCATLTLISPLPRLLIPSASANDCSDTTFLYSDTRWSLRMFLELDEAGQAVAQGVVNGFNYWIPNGPLSLPENPRAIITFHAVSNGYMCGEDYEDLQTTDGELYQVWFILEVNDADPCNEEGTSLLHLLPQTLVVLKNENELKITAPGATPKKKFEGKHVLQNPNTGMQIGSVEVKAEWLREEPEFWPGPGDTGVRYLRFFWAPSELQLYTTQRTSFSVAPEDIQLDVNFPTSPPLTALFDNRPITYADESFGKALTETIGGLSSACIPPSQ